MSIVITYLYPILFSLIFGYYNGWQWTDEQDGVYDPKKAKKRWKAASVALRFIAVFFPVAFLYWPIELIHFPLAVAISLPVFDITINLTRGVSVFYLGKTSKTDRIGKLKWLIYLSIIFTSVILKLKS